MRRALGLVASLSSACLFPSLDFTGGDAAADAGIDAPSDAPTETGEAGNDAGFTAGIGCAAATSDLLAYYTLDEGTGTTVHDCIQSPKNDGTILAPAHTSWVTGQHGKALEIDPGTGVCVNIDFTPSFTFGGANPFTVALWIQIVALPPANEIGYIAGQSSNISAAGWRFSVGMSGTLLFAVPDGKGGIANISGPKQIAAGAWHHVAAVYAGANSFVYLDSQPGSPQTLVASFTADGTSDHMRIGCSSDDQHQLNARVDDVRFYNRALSGAEIAIVNNAQ